MLVSGNRVSKDLITTEKTSSISYVGVGGGEGIVKCFIPKILQVSVDGVWNEIKNIWIGICEEGLTNYDAIAPAEVYCI